MLWHGAPKYGVVWFGTVWCSILWWDMRVLLGIVCCGVVLLVGQMQELYGMLWYGMQMQLGTATRRGNVPLSENIAHFALSSAHYPLGFLFSISSQPTFAPQPSNSTQHRPSLSFKATVSVEVLMLS